MNLSKIEPDDCLFITFSKIGILRTRLYSSKVTVEILFRLQVLKLVGIFKLIMFTTLADPVIP
jgi:hypothetical protein